MQQPPEFLAGRLAVFRQPLVQHAFIHPAAVFGRGQRHVQPFAVRSQAEQVQQLKLGHGPVSGLTEKAGQLDRCSSLNAAPGGHFSQARGFQTAVLAAVEQLGLDQAVENGVELVGGLIGLGRLGATPQKTHIGQGKEGHDLITRGAQLGSNHVQHAVGKTGLAGSQGELFLLTLDVAVPQQVGLKLVDRDEDGATELFPKAQAPGASGNIFVLGPRHRHLDRRTRPLVGRPLHRLDEHGRGRQTPKARVVVQAITRSSPHR